MFIKIIVYAIAYNEEKFINRWYNSMKEADEIYVLDTGSTDNTLELLKKLKVNVKQEIIKPFRFDIARNKSLEMVPMNVDLCVCTDIDEVFEKGWRKKLEEKYQNANRIRYNYIWSFNKYGNPEINFYQEKIHSRKGYTWTHPVHEILKCNLINEKITTIDDIVLKHYPDNTKSRKGYLPLLELSIKEDPLNDRNMHYLGREYMYNNEYNKAIETLKKHLLLEKATWKEERSASMRFICRCNKYLKKYEESIKYGLLAISETPHLREPYFELANVYYELKDYYKCSKYLELALCIETNPKTYINEPTCYNGGIEDLLSVCYYYTNERKKALKYVNKALLLDPENERIIENKKLIENSQD